MKKYTMVLAPFFFLVIILVSVWSFGLVESEKTSSKAIDIAEWKVKINDTLLSGASTNFTIESFNWNTSDYVKP